MNRAETLAMQLIVEPMTLEQMADFLECDVAITKVALIKMRHKVLPELGAWCPRPTYENGYVYKVVDSTPDSDDMDLCVAGAEATAKDNHARLVTMLRTATPYSAALDKRTIEGKKADLYVKAAAAALAALDLLE